MAVKIRMKKLGRKHRPFFRVCAIDCRAPRDGRVIEQLGTYDPMVPNTDARAILNGERIDYWLGVGAQPSPKVAVLIKKYGTGGSHLQQQADAIEKLGGRRAKAIEDARAAAAAAPKPKKEEPAAAEAPAADAEGGEAAAEAPAATEEAAEAKPAEEAAAEKPVEEQPVEEAKADDSSEEPEKAAE